MNQKQKQKQKQKKRRQRNWHKDGPVSPLPLSDWHGFSMVSYGPFLYLVGGITRGRWTNAVYRCDTRDGTFQALPPMATARRRCAAVVASLPSL